MPATDYRIMQLPNWSAGWDAVAPVVKDGLAQLENVILHSHNMVQKPADISVKRLGGANWLVITMSDKLPVEMEQHLNITAV
jgi:hypothetical protein